MAITDINISETLEAGAPSIKYTGNMNPNMEPNMQVASDPSWEAEWEDAYQNYKAKQIELGQEFVDKETFMDQYQNNMASGGRAHFGLGSIIKKITKPIKKLAKSPIGKAALLGGLGMWGMGAGPFSGGKLGGGFLSGIKPWLFGTPSSGIGALSGHGPGLWSAVKSSTPGVLGKLGLTGGGGSMMPTALGWGATALAGTMGATAFEGMSDEQITELKNNPEALRAHLTQYHSNTHPEKSAEEVATWVETQMYSTGGRVGLWRGSDRGIFSLSELINPRDPQNELLAEYSQIGKLPANITKTILELNRGGKSYEDIAKLTGVAIEDINKMLNLANNPDYIHPVSDVKEIGLNPKKYEVWDEIVKARDEYRDRPEHLDYKRRGQKIRKATGGRIGYAEGNDDMTISNNPNDPRNMTTLEIISMVKGDRSTPEMFKELMLRGIDGVKLLELTEFGKGKKGDVAYSFDERLLDEYDPDRKKADESFLFKMRESNPDLYGKYTRPREFYGLAEPTLMYKAKGGRIGFAYGPDQTAQAAGIMEGLPTRNNAAGVKELDLRDSGGFIPPVGVKEKADDIPAMLSNNEFVFTADAVRAAGGGSVEKGAQVMYDTMKNLENKVV